MPSSSAPGPGRKEAAAEARKAALLRHAREQLALHGFHNASLNEVARLSGGSKATIVKYFGNRTGLFAAVLAEQAVRLATELNLSATAGGAKTLEAALSDIGARLLDFYLQPEAIAFYRGMVASGDAELTGLFYDLGHGLIAAAIRTVLTPWLGRGLNPALDLSEAVGRFMHMLRSGLYEQALLGLVALPPDPKQVEGVVRGCVQLFLQGAGQP